MLRILSHDLRTGLATEPVLAVDDQALGELGINLQRRSTAALGAAWRSGRSTQGPVMAAGSRSMP